MEVELLQACGLLPNDPAVLRVQPEEMTRIPSGLELQNLFDATFVMEDELASEAEWH